MNLNVPLSGLQVASQRQDVTANNIANLNTNGYRARSLSSVEAQGGGVAPGELREDPTLGTPDVLSLSPEAEFRSNVNLATETAATIVNTAAYKANAAVVRVEDELLGALLDTRE